MTIEHNKPKYNYWRWPGIVGLFGIGCLGVVMIYWALFTPHAKELDWVIAVLGLVFLLFGWISAISQYVSGLAYTLESKIYFDEFEEVEHYNNGLFIVFNGRASLIKQHHAKIFERGWVKSKAFFNHKKRINYWYILHY